MDAQMTRKIRLRAAELVDQGWCQGVTARDEKGHISWATSLAATSWCMFGALKRAAFELLGSEEAVAVSDGLGSNPHWNDAPGRTADEVAARLREMAERG